MTWNDPIRLLTQDAHLALFGPSERWDNGTRRRMLAERAKAAKAKRERQRKHAKREKARRKKS